jgi:uncharacterized protein (DUF433 family)
MKANGTRAKQPKLVREMRGGEPYEYYPLGKYIVASPGVCRGRPTFKGTRIRVEFILDLIEGGWSIEQITQEYTDSEISAEAVREAIRLAKDALIKH